MYRPSIVALALLVHLLAAPGLSQPQTSPSAPLETHPVLLAGCEPDYPPYCTLTSDGKADGFSVELLTAALKAMGRKAACKVAPWPELKQDLAEGRLQVLPLVGRTPEREAHYDFTFPYLTMHGAIVVRHDHTDIDGPEDLSGRRVAVLRGDNAEEYLQRAQLGADIVPRPSFETALRELAAGKHDAVVIQKLLALQLMRKAGLKNLVIAGPPLKEFTQSFCFATRKGDSELLAILNEGLAITMADGTFRALYARWFTPLESAVSSRTRIVVGGDSNCPPYEFLDKDGHPAGFNVDVTHAIAHRMGLKVDIRLGVWNTLRRELAAGEIDLLQMMFYSPERNKEFDFSQPCSRVQHAAIVRDGTRRNASLKSFADKRIFVMAGNLMEELAKQQGLTNRLTSVSTQEEALRRLAAGEGDCALVAKIPALYWIAKNSWTNLHVSERSVFDSEPCYAALRGRDEVLAKFSEGLAALKATGDYRRIQAKWLGPYQPADFNLKKLASAAAAVFGPLLLLLGGSLFWSRSLRRKVAERTSSLTAEIAERERAEASLRESESRFRSLIESAPEAIFVQAEGRFIYCNPALLRLLSAETPQQLLGLSFFDRTAPEYHEAIRERIRYQRATGNASPLMEQQLLRLDGSRVSVETTAVAITFEGRDAHLVFVRDITARKTAETDREHLLTAIDQSNEVIVITDPDGTIRYVNPAFERVTGYARDEALGKNPRLLKSGKHDPAFYRALWDTILSGTTWKGRFVNRRKDASLYTEEATISPVRDRAGHIVSFVAVKRDITDQLLLESELLQSQKLESIGRLAGGVAHDFNNMLSVILGCAEQVQNDLPPDHPLFADLYEIRKAAERSADLTRQLLAFARKQTVAPKVLDLNDTVAKMLKMLRRLIGEDIELSWQPCTACTMVKIDPSQVDQALANLTVNARDAISGVGRIIIETGSVSLDAAFCKGRTDATPGKYITLAVRDTGCGMDAATLEHIFEPFFTTKGVGEGSGLGLSTVYGIMQQNGGFIAVASVPGEGTTFTLHLPACLTRDPETAESPETPAAALAAPASPRNILLVEDEPGVLKIAKRKLETLGYHVWPADTPGTALSLAEQHASKIDLLITDVIMPEMNGQALAERVRAFSPRLRCLFMSGYTANIVAQNGVLEQHTHFIQKPFSAKAFAAKVAEALADT